MIQMNYSLAFMVLDYKTRLNWELLTHSSYQIILKLRLYFEFSVALSGKE